MIQIGPAMFLRDTKDKMPALQSKAQDSKRDAAQIN